MEGALQATGPFYTDYQLAWERPEAEVLALFDPRRAEFLRDLLGRGRKAILWTHFSMESVLAAYSTEADFSSSGDPKAAGNAQSFC